MRIHRPCRIWPESTPSARHACARITVCPPLGGYARATSTLQVPHVKDSDEIFVVVVHAGEAKAGIVVDNLIGQQEIVIKTLGNLFAGLKMFSGATVLGDGRVALILDVATMMQQ